MSTQDPNAGQTRLVLDIDALASNLRVIRRHLSAEVKLCAVVKADAYGHSARLVSSMIADIEAAEPFIKVDQYAVATFDEAAELDERVKPVMLLRPIENAFLGSQREQIEHAVRAGWTMTLVSACAADDVARIAMHMQKRANVQIMIDTGMTRCGVNATQFDALLERVLHHASLKLTSVGTHLVNSEIPGDLLTTQQLRQFNSVIDRHPILESVPKHAANSGAIFNTPRAHYDVVRPGLSIYGVDPTGRPSTERHLRPIMTWLAPVIALHDVPAGQGVGYGHTWVATTASRIAIVPVGYADGYPRSLGNRAVVMIDETPCAVVGRVSMDMTAIDVTRVPDVCLGDDVTLIDNNPLSPASIYQLATNAGTISYELLTSIGRRVRRTCTRVTETQNAAVTE